MDGFQILEYLLDTLLVYHLELQEPKINVTDFLPILRIIFVSLGCNFVIFGGNFHSDYWSVQPLNRLYWQQEGPMLSYFCCLLSVCNVLLPLEWAAKFWHPACLYLILE